MTTSQHAERTVRKDAGRRARADGESLEEWLDSYHTRLARAGIAWVRRVGTPVSVLGRVSVDRRGRHIFRAAFDGYQGVDFTGFSSEGRHIVLEAKHHGADGSWDCGISPDGRAVDGGALNARQWDELVRAHAQQCLSLVILRAWDSCWALSVESIEGHVRRAKRRTIQPGEIAQIGRRLRGVEWWPS